MAIKQPLEARTLGGHNTTRVLFIRNKGLCCKWGDLLCLGHLSAPSSLPGALRTPRVWQLEAREGVAIAAEKDLEGAHSEFPSVTLLQPLTLL